jgi:hypothetical protein
MSKQQLFVVGCAYFGRARLAGCSLRREVTVTEKRSASQPRAPAEVSTDRSPCGRRPLHDHGEADEVTEVVAQICEKGLVD